MPPIRAKEVEAQAIERGIDLADEPRLQPRELRRIHYAFEDGELNTLAEALAQL